MVKLSKSDPHTCVSLMHTKTWAANKLHTANLEAICNKHKHGQEHQRHREQRLAQNGSCVARHYNAWIEQTCLRKQNAGQASAGEAACTAAMLWGAVRTKCIPEHTPARRIPVTAILCHTDMVSGHEWANKG